MEQEGREDCLGEGTGGGGKQESRTILKLVASVHSLELMIASVNKDRGGVGQFQRANRQEELRRKGTSVHNVTVKEEDVLLFGHT